MRKDSHERIAHASCGWDASGFVHRDSFAAGEILDLFIGDEPWKLDELVPGGSTFNAVEIAEDGSAAVFDVSPRTAWDALDAPRLGRIIVRR